MIYNISYDLIKPDKDYADLIAEIKSLGSWAHPLKSTWLIDCNLSVSQIRDRLTAIIDLNDKLMITACAKGAAWRNLHPDVEKWIKARL